MIGEAVLRHGLAGALVLALHLALVWPLWRLPAPVRAPEVVMAGLWVPPPPKAEPPSPAPPKPAPPAPPPPKAAPRPVPPTPVARPRPPVPRAAPARAPEPPAPTGVEAPARAETSAEVTPPAASAAEAPAAAPPAPAPVYRAPVFAAAYLHNPRPPYPLMSRKRHEEGVVRLRVRVSAAGRVETLQVHASSGHARLDLAAREAVAQWRFEPARRGDAAEAAWVEVPIEFKLES